MGLTWQIAERKGPNLKEAHVGSSIAAGGPLADGPRLVDKIGMEFWTLLENDTSKYTNYNKYHLLF